MTNYQYQGDLSKKAEWANVTGLDTTPIWRTLEDLPSTVTPGARQVTMLSRLRVAHNAVYQDVKEALETLAALPPETWQGGFFVFEKNGQSWRDAPFKHYASFEDFYTRELAATWGDWIELQATWQDVALGKLDRPAALKLIRLSAQALAQSGDVTPTMTHAEAGALGGRGKKMTERRSDGSTSAYRLVRRLKRDAPDIAVRLANGEFRSARAAALAAGIIRPPPTWTERLRTAWGHCTEAEQRAFLAEHS